MGNWNPASCTAQSNNNKNPSVIWNVQRWLCLLSSHHFSALPSSVLVARSGSPCPCSGRSMLTISQLWNLSSKHPLVPWNSRKAWYWLPLTSPARAVFLSLSNIPEWHHMWPQRTETAKPGKGGKAWYLLAIYSVVGISYLLMVKMIPLGKETKSHGSLHFPPSWEQRGSFSCHGQPLCLWPWSHSSIFLKTEHHHIASSLFLCIYFMAALGLHCCLDFL